jgi:murein L,D-transpeptidase YcbB/YkuD
MYEDGRVQDHMKVVVGKRDTPTPMLAGTIHFVTFNPYWNIPTDVASKNVAPLVLKRGTDYLRAARYEVASHWSREAAVLDPETIDWKAVADGTREVHVRQLPGPENMMGAVKFGFYNELGIYLHDTPFKELLDKPKRNFSLGCVRVEDAERLARWMLRREPVAPSSEPEQYVKLDKGIPVYITYLTARADGGELAFVDDVYGRDPKADTGLAELQPLPSTAGSADSAYGAAIPATRR